MVVHEPTYESNWIMMGDGRLAVLINLKDVDEYWEFEMKPTDWMKYKYQIEEANLNQDTLTIKKKFPKDLCVPLDLSPKSSCWLILCNWDGTDKESLIDKFNRQLLEINRALKKENGVFRALLLRQFFAIDKAVKFPSESRKLLMDEIQETKKAISTPKEEPRQE